MTKEQIISTLKRHNITQRQLAERMGISRQALDYSLNSDMRASTLERIADAIGCSVGELFGEHSADCRCPHCGHSIKIKLE